MQQLPAHLAHLAGRNLAVMAQQGIGGSMSAHVSIRQNRFRLVDGANQEKLINALHLDVVIVDVNPGMAKQYYADAYDVAATDYKPPTCTSDDGVRPMPSSPQVQADLCMTCPRNAWGSKTSQVTGKMTKECSDGKKVAVMPIDSDMVFLLRIPPASLKPFGQFCQTLAGNNADLNLVITRLTFDAKTQGMLNFTPQDWIDAPTADKVYKIDLTKTGAIVGRISTGSGSPAAAIEAPKEEPKQVGMFGQGQQVSTQGPAQSSFQSPAQEQAPEAPKPRTRRTKAEMEAERAAQAPAGQETVENEDEDAKAFREFKAQRDAAKAAKDNRIVGAPKDEPQSMFGMQTAEVVEDSALSAAINEALNLPVE